MSAQSPASSLPYKNPALPVEERVRDLLGRMTVEEKVGQLIQLPINTPLPETSGEMTVATPEGCRRGLVGSILSGIGLDTVAYAQAATESRLGIPVLVAIDAIHGHTMWHEATVFPSQLGLSCAWDEELCRQVGRVTAREMAHNGLHWTFSPVLCLPRDLRWGRTGETFGEDKLLISRLGAAMIRGYQGDSLSDPHSVAACAKHYVGYGESLGGRDASESLHSRRTLRMEYLPPFEAAARAGCATFMSAYHAIDGVPVVFNRWLMTDLLRGEWGWKGMVVTDWDIIRRMHSARHVARTTAESAARTLRAGNDLIMTTPGYYKDTLENLRNGVVTIAEVDEACARILRLKFQMGLFENPRLADLDKTREQTSRPEHRELALEAAKKSLVLMKNRGILPLARRPGLKLAVIGPNSDDWQAMVGDWAVSAGQGQGVREVYPEGHISTVLQGLRAVAGAQVSVSHAVGCGIETLDSNGYPPRWRRSSTGLGAREAMPEKIPAAVRLASESDVAVLVLGDFIHNYVGEAKSTATLQLPGEQQALFDAVLATGTPVVVVLLTSKPLALPEVFRRADAIVCAHNPGMQGGVAIGGLLFGDFNPTGRLTISWPWHVGQCPVHYCQSKGTHQEAYPDLPGVGLEPAYAFGHGLCYTTFKYRAAYTPTPVVKKGGRVELRVIVRNMGNRAGEELVQVYLRQAYSSVVWPDRLLKDWARVHLEVGEEKTVSLSLPWDSLALCDAEGRWVVEPGDFELLVGPSSREAELLRVPFTAEA